MVDLHAPFSSSWRILTTTQPIKHATIRLAIADVVAYVILIGVIFSLYVFGGSDMIWVIAVALLIGSLAITTLNLYYRATISWMTYELSRGNPAVYAKAAQRARDHLWPLVHLAVYSMIVKAMTNSNRRQRGVLGQIDRIGSSMARTTWRAIEMFAVPGVIIPEHKSLHTALGDLRSIATNMSGAMMGLTMVWIAPLVSLLVVLPVWGLVVLSVVYVDSIVVFVLAVIVAVVVSILSSAFIQVLKVIYFTLYYIQVTGTGDIHKVERTSLV